MNLHEYQAKMLFSDYGLPVPVGSVALSADEVEQIAASLSTKQVVVKAQIHAGGRGKAGGVKLFDTPLDAKQFASELLGTRLVTFQTDANGQPVHRILVEEVCTIDRELYLGAVIDRATCRITIMASTEGGMNIEEVATNTPEKILTIQINPMTGVMPYQCRELAFGLALEGTQIKQFTQILMGLGHLFTEKDLSLVEINPLVVTAEGTLLCLDGKINVDGNALFRHPELVKLQDEAQEDKRERQAAKWDLNYVALEGNIGCMVNGAGLAMGTMDIIKLQGGDPANFLDVGGAATAKRVTEAFKIILSDEKVKGILVNIFGGIVRCDLIAEGIIAAIKEVNISVPVVVRLEGNHAPEGTALLDESGLDLISATDLTDAANKIVTAVGEAK
ncbi:MAG: ADP-forming succinate--CoA ligase subunit beta [Cocleimonas sp.]|nr:ADP-forming succinate--CoA ligase subunit beta [Cocleimonas sp.]